ncbi:MAG: 6,7-dimethyl-8-ribityllumazine synthase [Actinomycetia bacterium]|nr:6,7-dimethyl-8-ribityllumazine synthase [Actinomycetes bacterium]
MTDGLRGRLDAGDLRIGVVRSLFNRPVTEGLLDGALAVLDEAGATDVTVVDVEGAFETPLVAQTMAQAGYDAIVVLGAVVEGETDHYEHIAGRASEGLMRVMLDTGVPVSFGILTVRDPSHAFARSAPDEHNKGREAAEAAIRTADVLKQVSSRAVEQ